MDKLARYIIILGTAAIILFIAWYFKSILIYIAISAVISMIGKPIVNMLCKIRIKKISFPRWLATIVTLIFIGCICLSLFLLLTPMIGEINNMFSNLNVSKFGADVQIPLDRLNQFIIKYIPSAGSDFRIEVLIIDYLKKFFSMDMFSNLLASVTSFILNLGISIFSIAFISFFMLLENGLITNTLTSILPSKYEEQTTRALSSINRLLSRYFVGISLESLFITILNSLGLIFIAKMHPTLAIVIAFTSGILNIVPYVGPLIGEILAVLMGVITYINYGAGIAMTPYLLVILAIFLTTQLIDNYVFQPLIYSNSVKAHPLEIFLIILVAGHIGGVFGILIAIPTYTVIRVIASEFLSRSNSKFLQKLNNSLKA